MKTRLLPILLILLLFPFIGDAWIGKPLSQIKIEHKDDLVVLINGDKITGEIKKMEFGVLYLKSDLAVDTLELDWERVAFLQSIAVYEFETRTNVYIGKFFGKQEDDTSSGLAIQLQSGPVTRLLVTDILAIHEIGRSVLSRLSLALDAGGSFTSANDRIQANVHLSASFRKPKYSGSLDLSSQFSGEPGTEETSRHELQLNSTRYLNTKWDVIALAAFLQGNQQELELRSTFGGGVLRKLLETNRTVIYAITGAVYTNEQCSSEVNPGRNNAEAALAFGASTYRFGGSSLDGVVWVYPSLSDPGRVRIDSNLTWRWEIIGDLYWMLSFLDNYDNSPPPDGINHNMSISTTVGWSF